MNAENMKDLAAVRYEKAKEILKDAEKLLAGESFSSANNRAFYAAELLMTIFSIFFITLK